MGTNLFYPGFGFHPTDVVLVNFFLKRKVLGKKLREVISELNIYTFRPWELPDKSCLRTGDLEWYFFCPRAKKHFHGSKINRTAIDGHWKVTGRGKSVHDHGHRVGIRNSLVFYNGCAGKGEKTNWVMHEYKLDDKRLKAAGVDQDSYVVCKIFKKDGAGPKNGAQYGAPLNEQVWDEDPGTHYNLPFLPFNLTMVNSPEDADLPVLQNLQTSVSVCTGLTYDLGTSEARVGVNISEEGDDEFSGLLDSFIPNERGFSENMLLNEDGNFLEISDLDLQWE